jgi:hypothetical protein
MQEDLVSTSHNQTDNGKGGNRKSNIGIDVEIEEFLNFDPHQEFLPLNDVIPTCNLAEQDEKINLHAIDRDTNDTTNIPMSARRRSSILDSVSRRRSSYRPSIGSTALFMDQSYVTDGSGSMMNVATQKALLGALDSTGMLRLQSGVCDIGEDGILRIPGSSLQKSFTEENIVNSSCVDNNDANFEAGNDGDSNDDGGFVVADNDECNTVEVATSQEKSKRVTFSDTTNVLMPSKLKERQHDDPWALLDSDTTNIRKPRPLRIGKTIVLPETVDKLPSECVTGARTRYNARIKQERVPNVKLLQASSGRSYDTLFSTFPALGNKRVLSKNLSCPLNERTYGNEFAYIAKAFAKRQADKRRELRNSSIRERQSDKSDIPKVIHENIDDYFDEDVGGGFDDDNDADFDLNVGNGDDMPSENAPFESNTGIASISEVFKSKDTRSDFGMSVLTHF